VDYLIKMYFVLICGVECEEQHNYDDFFPYCEDCNISVEYKKRRTKEKKFAKIK
jgi:hypothetical protein